MMPVFHFCIKHLSSAHHTYLVCVIFMFQLFVNVFIIPSITLYAQKIDHYVVSSQWIVKSICIYTYVMLMRSVAPVATRWIRILDFSICRGSDSFYFVKFAKYAVGQANVWHENSDRRTERVLRHCTASFYWNTSDSVTFCFKWRNPGRKLNRPMLSMFWHSLYVAERSNESNST